MFSFVNNLGPRKACAPGVATHSNSCIMNCFQYCLIDHEQFIFSCSLLIKKWKREMKEPSKKSFVVETLKRLYLKKNNNLNQDKQNAKVI